MASERLLLVFFFIPLIYFTCANHHDSADHDDTNNIKNEREAFWSKWGKWSNCSRKCGGGITMQQRDCIKINNVTNATCRGESVIYRMCNIQDCPDDSVDFRMEQCAKYDNKTYKGKYYKWAGFHHNAGECELKCMPKGLFFYVTFSRKVIDGTQCNPYTNDVCINGSCVSVGCDMQLYSQATVDNCGVCNGKNDTCRLVKDTFYPSSDSYDYVDITTIPAGATNIRIKETGLSENYLALTSGNKNILNGDRFFSPSRTEVYDGSTMKYKRTKERNEINITGPLSVPIQVQVYVFSNVKQPITYEYFISNSVRDKINEKIRYDWVPEQWGECSRTCATGRRTRNIYCENSATRKVVKDFHCTYEKPIEVENCNEQSCPSKWYISQWSPCSVTCGEGSHTRRVHCLETSADGNVNMLDFARCEGAVPVRVRKCDTQKQCPEWHSEEWSQCSQTCGKGFQRRKVDCMDARSENSVEAAQCSRDQRPVDYQECHNAPCGSNWVTGEWNKCSTHCGVGVRSRSVSCKSATGIDVPLEHCNKEEEPKYFDQCNAEGPCRPSWHATQWSNCTAKCGSGMQMRSVLCVETSNNRLYVVDTNLCVADKKPLETQRCNNKKPCYTNYFVSKWSECSATCGMGIQKRTVRCYADRTVDHTEETCKDLVRPVNVQLCDEVKCDTTDDKITDNQITTTTTTSRPTTTTTNAPVEHIAPKVVSLEGPELLHESDNADYECIASGSPTPKISWTLRGKPIVSSRFHKLTTKNGGRLVILAAGKQDAGELRCQVENKAGVAWSMKILKVSGPPKATISPKYVEHEEGDQTVIKCDVEGTPEPRVQWTKDGYSFYGDNNRVVVHKRNIYFKRVIVGDTGKYRCNAYNNAGSSTDLMTLSVSRKEKKEIPAEDCFDDNRKADCRQLQVLPNICNIPHYNKVCCATCNRNRQ